MGDIMLLITMVTFFTAVIACIILLFLNTFNKGSSSDDYYTIRFVDPTTKKAIRVDGTKLQSRMIPKSFDKILNDKFGYDNLYFLHDMTGMDSIAVIEKLIDGLTHDPKADIWADSESNARDTFILIAMLADIRPDAILQIR